MEMMGEQIASLWSFILLYNFSLYDREITIERLR